MDEEEFDEFAEKTVVETEVCLVADNQFDIFIQRASHDDRSIYFIIEDIIAALKRRQQEG